MLVCKKNPSHEEQLFSYCNAYFSMYTYFDVTSASLMVHWNLQDVDRMAEVFQMFESPFQMFTKGFKHNMYTIGTSSCNCIIFIP